MPLIAPRAISESCEMELRIVSVNVARPRVLTALEGHDVLSAIGKMPVEERQIFVGRTNLEGDAQADLSVHGGVDKAVYAYPSAHWPWWQDKGFMPAPALFGENLTLTGAAEDDIRIGDRFHWGETVLEVSQPRGPCYKLGLHTSRADAPQLMTLSARCGWYLRVIEEGFAPVADGLLTRFQTFDHAPSVSEAFRALYHPRQPQALIRKVHDTKALAGAWREGLANRLARGM